MAEKRGAGGKNQEYSENNGEYLSSCEQTPVESVDKGQTARKSFRRRTPLERVGNIGGKTKIQLKLVSIDPSGIKFENFLQELECKSEEKKVKYTVNYGRHRLSEKETMNTNEKIVSFTGIGSLNLRNILTNKQCLKVSKKL